MKLNGEESGGEYMKREAKQGKVNNSSVGITLLQILPRLTNFRKTSKPNYIKIITKICSRVNDYVTIEKTGEQRISSRRKVSQITVL